MIPPLLPCHPGKIQRIVFGVGRQRSKQRGTDIVANRFDGQYRKSIFPKKWKIDSVIYIAFPNGAVVGELTCQVNEHHTHSDHQHILFNVVENSKVIYRKDVGSCRVKQKYLKMFDV